MSLSKIRTVNVSKYAPNPPVWKNVSALMPQGPDGVVLVGITGAGKTSVLVSSVLQPKVIKFDRILVYAQDIEEDVYTVLREFLKDHPAAKRTFDDGIPGIVMSNDFSEMPPLTAFDKKYQTILILDDFNNKKKQEMAEDVFKGGRKRNIMAFYLAQYFFGIPKYVRMNAKWYMFFRLTDQRQIRQIGQSIDRGGMTLQAFERMYRDAIKPLPKSKTDPEQHKKPMFLLVNGLMDYLPYKFRKGFNRVLKTVAATNLKA